jgi:hypothetical protein
MVRGFRTLFLLLFSSAVAGSQANPATVSFTLDFPGSVPEHYSIQIDSDGKARYESTTRAADSDQVDNYEYKFNVSPVTREKVFDLSARSGYFQKDLDAHRKNMAFTGKKTLGYKDSQRTGDSTFNYSANQSVQELTELLQGLSATLEFGHRLEFARRYQKLALADELRRMEESARVTPPVEIQAIAPILQQIVADSGVINVTRARAQRLLDTPTAR